MNLLCPNCGIPLDAGIFDVSNIFRIDTPGEALVRGEQNVSLAEGETVELATFELSQEYCGTLLYFAQFTDRFASNPRAVLTPGYEWALRVNGLPLSPWLTFDHILNPWGMAGFPLAVRLEANSTISMTVRNVDVVKKDPARWLRRIGGRIVGRYWFAEEHGGPSPLHTRDPKELQYGKY